MPATRFILGVGLIVLAMTVTACGGGEGSSTTAPASTTAAPVTSTTTTAAPTTTVAAPATTTSGAGGIDWVYSDPDTLATVTLLDPGAEPRAVRTWRPAIGNTFEGTMSVSTSLDQSVDEISAVTSFSVDQRVTLAIVDITDEGIVTATTMGAAIVTATDASTQESVQELYNEASGAIIYQLTAADGTVLALGAMENIPGNELLSNGIGGIVVPLPSEPIGKGAIWEARGRLESGGIVFDQTTTITVTDIVGDRLFIDLAIDQEVDPSSPALAGIESFSIEMDGTSSAVWDLALGFPISGSSEAVQTLNASIPVGDATQTLIQVTEVTFALVQD